ncbi:MAG TPA: hypothetical protein VM261_19460 [Kofleriaceae bacterium]|nr:hypothetical protein [Kofleriaceae bacterium]
MTAPNAAELLALRARRIGERTDVRGVALGALLKLREDALPELRRSIDRQMHAARAAFERAGAPLAPALAEQLRAYDAQLELDASTHPPEARGVARLVEWLERFVERPRSPAPD